jgi:hypothetical protein
MSLFHPVEARSGEVPNGSPETGVPNGPGSVGFEAKVTRLGWIWGLDFGAAVRLSSRRRDPPFARRFFDEIPGVNRDPPGFVESGPEPLMRLPRKVGRA